MKAKSASTDGSHGITAIQGLVKFIILAIQKSTRLDDNKDGKISLLEGLSLITTLGFKIPAVYNALPDVITEWKDITEAERDQLVDWFKEEFDLPGLEHGRIKEIIKESVDAISDCYTHYTRLRAILG